MSRVLTFLTLSVLCLSAVQALADEAKALALINERRAAKGCDALTVDPRLQAAAERHARAMAEQDFFSHKGKDGSTFDQRIHAAGYDGRRLAENIAAGQATAGPVLESWMSSPGHRRNILDCRFSDTGLALVHQKSDKPLPGHSAAFHYYWVQTFGTPR